MKMEYLLLYRGGKRIHLDLCLIDINSMWNQPVRKGSRI